LFRTEVIIAIIHPDNYSILGKTKLNGITARISISRLRSE